MDGNKVIKGIAAVFVLFMLIGAFAGEDDTDSDTIVEEPDVVKTPQTVQAEAEPESQLDTEPELEVEDEYQDLKWRQKVSVWAPVMASDLEHLSVSMSNMEFSEIESDASLLESSCSMALEDSKQYKVSPALQTAKSEYEAGLADYITTAEEIQIAMEYVNSGDLDTAIVYLNVAEGYMDSGSRHITAASASMP